MSMNSRTDAYTALVAEPPLDWGAVLAGAATTLAVSIFGAVLATGFGYSLATSGLPTRGTLSAFTPETGAGAVAIQVVAAALGGYLAGRLRPGWTTAHGDESHFRDTAHGFLAWAVSTVGGLLLAALVLNPYAERLAGATVATPSAHAADIATQSAFFIGVGMLLSAFAAAVAGRLGGMRSEHMRALADL